MLEKLRFLINRVGERLWVKPLLACILSLVLVFLAKTADGYEFGRWVPEITKESVEALLSIIASSMMVIATFAVGSMVAAYNSAGMNATPRSFSVVIADDESQNALSTFIGTFIFSIVALIALKNGYYDSTSRFVIFALTIVILAMVIVTFVRWVDRIARLGRLGNTIQKVEAATCEALLRRRRMPNLGGVPVSDGGFDGIAVRGKSIGYLQRIDVATLQRCAERHDALIRIAVLPGSFVTPDRVLAYMVRENGAAMSDIDEGEIASAFLTGHERKFDDDPRFGLIVLAQIATRALSPAVNDPGTAIDIIASLVRLFALWVGTEKGSDAQAGACQRVEVPELSMSDMFEDAFKAIGRDGAGSIEVVVRLHKAFGSLAALGDPVVSEAARAQSRLALARSQAALTLPDDLKLASRIAGRVDSA
ncbi:MAG: DUF2254 domain-containing protein [Gammaproteobacteria bacterium]|nr:DUF2254 domain-containing protein [Gammaproteobacteria bacterium]